MNYLIVQLSGSEALFARFQLKRGMLVIQGTARETIDEKHTLASLLAEAGAVPGREGERIILVIPPGRLFLREMELPISDRRKIREILPLELKGETAFDPILALAANGRGVNLDGVGLFDLRQTCGGQCEEHGEQEEDLGDDGGFHGWVN